MLQYRMLGTMQGRPPQATLFRIGNQGRYRPVAEIGRLREGRGVTEIIYLSPGEQMPDVGDDQPWLVIEVSVDGRFLGSGASWKASGEWVGYGSLVEDDVSLKTALVAAQEWATKYGVPTIWVQATP